VDSEFSRYRVVSRVGQGGMGEVFLAEDISLARKVALKFLSPGDQVDEAGRRILLEARAAAHLDHPFICKVYEVGEREGRPFLAMEFVDGVTLRDRLLQRQIPVSAVVRIGREVADALHFAHTRGIVHRDLKPANVMLTPDDHVKVMDFGIAKRISGTSDGDAATAVVGSATGVGQVTGTFGYMSPEQLRGDSLDGRSDIFAFGMLLYELLTGRNPFTRPTAIATISAILTEPATPVETIRKDTPPHLAHIVTRCLEKDRDRRYQSLADVRLELEAVESGTASTAAVRKTRRRWMGWVAAAAVVALTSVGLWMRPAMFSTSRAALAFAERDWVLVADFNNLTGDAVFDRSLRLAIEVAIAQSQYVNVFPQNRVAATFARMQRQPDERLDESLATEVAVREGVRAVLACDIAQLGNVYSLTARLIDPHTRAAVLTDSIEAASKDQVLAALGELATRVRSNLGESMKGLSDQSSALPQVTTASLDALKLYADSLKTTTGNDGQSNAMLQQALALDDDFALAHAELGRRYYLASSRATRELAEKHLVRALSLTNRLTLRERLWIQAVAEDSRGNRERAVDAYKAYLAQYPDDTRALFRLAWTQMATLGDAPAAVEGFGRVLKLEPDNASAQVNLATALSANGDHAAAVPAYQRAFELDPRLAVGVFINHEYGVALAHLGRLDEAARHFEKMKKEGDAADQPRGFRSMALLEMLRGRYGAAVQELRSAVSLDQTLGQTLSEFRDRLYLISALEATARGGEAAAEWQAVDRLVTTLSLSPNWLWRPVRMRARSGRLADARRYLQVMQAWAGKATADSGISRNIGDDGAYISAAEAEIALAEGRAARAIERVEPAQRYLKISEPLFTLAAAYAAAGRIDDAIARYEEFVKNPPLGNEGQQVWFEAHLALGKLYEQRGGAADARRVYEALAARWVTGDADITLLRDVRDRLTKRQP
jgi:tetratricopeptide (TPR) repeat protein